MTLMRGIERSAEEPDPFSATAETRTNFVA